MIGYYWDHLSNHVLLPTPSGVPASPDAALTLAPGWNIPRHPELRDDWPFENAAELVWDIAQKMIAATEPVLSLKGMMRTPAVLVSVEQMNAAIHFIPQI